MPRVTSSETPTWTVLCFFVARPYRYQHIASAMLEAAVAYAREQGAMVVEGYPFDTAGITSAHRGHSRMFKALGFQLVRLQRHLAKRSSYRTGSPRSQGR
jgi:GNAT superfamily N-acetyltransferase